MEIELETEAATREFAEDLALCLRRGDKIALSGDLGAGKSFLARALIRALADNAQLEVPSPSFTLAQIYEETRIPLLHADIYRLETEAETEELGFAEFAESGIILAEWAEKAPRFRQSAQFRLNLIETGESSRRLTIEAAPEAEQRLRHSLAIRAFLTAQGRGAARRRRLQGDASSRFYEKLNYPPESGGKARQSEILMDAPPPKTDKARAAYIKKVHLAADNRQFAAVDRLLRSQGFAAPQIYAANQDSTLLILEDLGDDRLTDSENKPMRERYLACAEFLAYFQQTDWQKQAAAQNYTLPAYDEAALQTECALFLDFYMPYKTGETASAACRRDFLSLWQPLFAEAQTGQPTLILRDFHSPNILWQADLADAGLPSGAENGRSLKRIGLIDFQDALLGSRAYDLVSLAQDARADISAELEAEIRAAYNCAAAAFAADFDARACRRDYAILGAQRACKILGAFIRLSQSGKSAYIRHLPRIETYLRRNMAEPHLSALKSWLQANGLL